MPRISQDFANAQMTLLAGMGTRGNTEEKKQQTKIIDDSVPSYMLLAVRTISLYHVQIQRIPSESIWVPTSVDPVVSSETRQDQNPNSMAGN